MNLKEFGSAPVCRQTRKALFLAMGLDSSVLPRSKKRSLTKTDPKGGPQGRVR
jgi:hypothetical protein